MRYVPEIPNAINMAGNEPKRPRICGEEHSDTYVKIRILARKFKKIKEKEKLLKYLEIANSCSNLPKLSKGS